MRLVWTDSLSTLSTLSLRSNRRRPNPNRQCRRCGVTPITGNRYCGKSCRDADIRERARTTGKSAEQLRAEISANAKINKVYICVGCGVVFKPQRTSATSYCSRKCAAVAHSTRCREARVMRDAHRELQRMRALRRKCAQCGVEFIASSNGQQVCSDACREVRRQQVYVARYGPKIDEPRRCSICSVWFWAQRGMKFCSKKCRKKAHRQINRRKFGRKIRQRARRYGVRYERFNIVSVFKRDKWTCQLCGVATPRALRGSNDPTAPELDHILPMSRGGDHVRSNVQCLCRSCNGAKNDKILPAGFRLS